MCAVVVAGILGGAAQPGQPKQQPGTAGQPTSTTEETRQQRNPNRVKLAEDARQSEYSQQPAESQAAQSGPSPWYDLWAQGLMALWAFFQLLLTGIGIYYIRETLKATKAAVVEAADGTKAALRSAAVAEKALIGVERPFLVIEPGRAAPSAQYYSFVNYGRTPCVIVKSDVRFLPITPLDAPEPLTANMWQAALTPGWNVVGANGGASSAEFVRLGKPIVPDAERAEMKMLHGYVVYRSLTGDTFVSGFGLCRKAGEPWKALSEAAFNYDERLETGGPRKRARMKVTITASDPGET